MTHRLPSAAVRLSCLAALLLAACKRANPPPPATAPLPTSTSWVQSVDKLAGAPARVLRVTMAPDGASVLVTERRASKDERHGGLGTFAVSRRPIGGAPAKDLLASESPVLAMAPLGPDVLVLERPPFLEEKPGVHPVDERETLDEKIAVLEQAAVYRLADGGPPVRVSPEKRRCLNLVAAEGGRWAAYSLAAVDRPLYLRLAPGDEETHVLGASPGEDITLSVKGLVTAVSPDGARVILRRPPEVPDGGARRQWKRPEAREDAKGMVMVTVKDQTVSDLPATLQVYGAAVETEKLFVTFAGDGLLFRSEKGDIYRSALDGSNATRLAAALPDTDAGAGEAAGPEGDAGAPAAKERRFVGPKGTVFVLHEEAGAVVLTAAGGSEPLARFEGPLAAIGATALDAAERRAALAVLSDTSRNGGFEASFDDAEVFVTDERPGTLSFGRAPAPANADDLRARVAAAAGVAESAVRLAPKLGSVEVTTELPWIEGEGTTALLDRAFAAARAVAGVVTDRDAPMRLRVGPLDLRVVRVDDEGADPYLMLSGNGISLSDPAATRLVLTNPVRTTVGFSGTQVLTGALENRGDEPTPPIEVFAKATTGYGGKRQRREVTKDLGSIAPGKRARFSLTLADVSYDSPDPHSRFRVGGKPLVVHNQYTHDHSVDWLEAALAVRAAHGGAWAEDAAAAHGYFGRRDPVRVTLTAAQAALPDKERDALLRSIVKVLDAHRRRFHRDEANNVTFAAPDGGGWRLAEGIKIKRFEKGDKEEKGP